MNFQNYANGLAGYALLQDHITSTIYVVNLENAGVTHEKQVYQLGWRTANLANINIDRVEPIQLIHIDESKQEIWRASHDVLDSVIAYGTGQCAFERATSYTQQRIQFGEPLTQFQVVRHKLVDIGIERENLNTLSIA